MKKAKGKAAHRRDIATTSVLSHHIWLSVLPDHASDLSVLVDLSLRTG